MIPDYADSLELKAQCQSKLDDILKKEEQIKKKNEEERRLIEIKEQERIAAQKKRNKKIVIISIVILISIISIISAYCIIIKPLNQYNIAVDLMESGKYDEAIETFGFLGEYKDCDIQILNCKYGIAIDLMENEEYEAAIIKFKDLDGYKDSNTYIENCNNCILERDYNKALGLIADEQYQEAFNILKKMRDYKDSSSQLAKCTEIIEKEKKYQEAIDLAADSTSSSLKVLKTLDPEYKNVKDYIENYESLEPYIGKYLIVDGEMAVSFRLYFRDNGDNVEVVINHTYYNGELHDATESWIDEGVYSLYESEAGKYYIKAWYCGVNGIWNIEDGKIVINRSYDGDYCATATKK